MMPTGMPAGMPTGIPAGDAGGGQKLIRGTVWSPYSISRITTPKDVHHIEGPAIPLLPSQVPLDLGPRDPRPEWYAVVYPARDLPEGLVWGL